jgi:hypothetical protein
MGTRWRGDWLRGGGGGGGAGGGGGWPGKRPWMVEEVRRGRGLGIIFVRLVLSVTVRLEGDGSSGFRAEVFFLLLRRLLEYREKNRDDL